MATPFLHQVADVPTLGRVVVEPARNMLALHVECSRTQYTSLTHRLYSERKQVFVFLTGFAHIVPQPQDEPSPISPTLGLRLGLRGRQEAGQKDRL